MKTTNFIRIGDIRFDLNKIHRYWIEEKKIGLNDGTSVLMLTFETNADRDRALEKIDAAAMELIGINESPPTSITFSRGNEGTIIPLNKPKASTE